MRLTALSTVAGTNFLIRAAAFKQAGWSPEFTLTEDFALGMLLKMHKWHCRYVEEYLAVGEAPDEVRNCFQQRSRWCKVRPQSHAPQSSINVTIHDHHLHETPRIAHCDSIMIRYTEKSIQKSLDLMPAMLAQEEQRHAVFR